MAKIEGAKMMSDERLKDILREVLDEHVQLTVDAHHEHHEFIKQWIDRERIKAERWEDIRRQLCGVAAISLVGSIGLWVQDYALAVIKAAAHSIGVRF
jgi:hypothetical protein